MPDTVQINYCNSHFLLQFIIKLLINKEKDYSCCIWKLLKEKCDQTIHCKIKGQSDSDTNQENVKLLEKRIGYVNNM